MSALPSTKAWVRFLRNYGPIPTNDNMYDESIQRALKRLKIRPISLPAPLCDKLVDTFRSANPVSHIITGTAGDGKTYHCREVWNALGGNSEAWDNDDKIKTLSLGDKSLIIVKDLSELRDEESSSLIAQFAGDAANPAAKRFYIFAANHGQLLEKLKSAPDTPEVKRVSQVIEDLLVTGVSRDEGIKLNLDDLSRTPAADMARAIIKEVTDHEGWSGCDTCEARSDGKICPIFENRNRLKGDGEGSAFTDRLISLIELSERNGGHFPVRQLLALAANSILGHPSPNVRDGLMTCNDVAGIQAEGRVGDASVYRNIFGENLRPSRAEKTELFKKLNAFGIGSETSNRIDNMLVYGADDPAYSDDYQRLVLADPIYGATPAYVSAQRSYLEGAEESDRTHFLAALRAQRQRLFFTLPEDKVDEYALWDLTVFRYGGLYLEVASRIQAGAQAPRNALSMIVRGLNRIFTGMLVQNQDELVLATSGSYSQSQQSPLLDEIISVPRSGGEEVGIDKTSGPEGFSVSVKLVRGSDIPPISLPLSATRFEFLGRVAEGALPSSFSLECHEDLLAFKARLLRATDRRFFARTGELLYLMLSRSSQVEALRPVLIQRFFENPAPYDGLVCALQGEAQLTKAERGGAYLPCSSHPIFDRIAADWISILQLPIPVYDAIPHLVAMTGLNLILYQLDRARELLGSEPIEFVCEIVSPKKSVVRDLSADSYQRNNMLPQQAIERYIRRVTEGVSWHDALISDDPTQSAIDILKREFSWPDNDEDAQGTDPQALVDDLVNRATIRHKQHVGKIHMTWARSIGLASRRSSRRVRYAPTDRLLKTLVVACVPERIEFKDFLTLLYERYGFVIGDAQAKPFVDQGVADQEAFSDNAQRLEDRLASLGLLKRLSDSCAYVENPYQRDQTK